MRCPPAGPVPAEVIRFGVIGYGYWAPNIIRNLGSLPRAHVTAVCDKNEDALRRAAQANPGLTLSSDSAEVVSSPLVDAIAVVTPVWTHYPLAKAALENG